MEILLPDNVVGLGQVPSHRKLGPSSAQWFWGEMQMPALEGGMWGQEGRGGTGGGGREAVSVQEQRQHAGKFLTFTLRSSIPAEVLSTRSV